MKISVVITSFNYSKYIGEAIRSVENQTFPVTEIIIVDDCSTDHSANFIRNTFPKVKLIALKENVGVASALNIGIRESSGELIALLDGDDYWHSQKIEKQFHMLKSNPTYDACFTLLKQFISPDLTEEEKKKCFIPQEIMVGHTKITMLAKKEIFDRIGLFEEGRKFNDFIEWFARAKRGKIIHDTIHEVLAFRRIKKISLSQSALEKNPEMIQILRKHLQSKRNEKPKNQ
jgi:glycosyltransferase involved in cell wall biosynthesis